MAWPVEERTPSRDRCLNVEWDDRLMASWVEKGEEDYRVGTTGRAGLMAQGRVLGRWRREMGNAGLHAGGAGINDGEEFP